MVGRFDFFRFYTYTLLSCDRNSGEVVLGFPHFFHSVGIFLLLWYGVSAMPGVYYFLSANVLCWCLFCA